MTKIILYYGFDKDDTNYHFAKVSAHEDKETINLPIAICRNMNCSPKYNKGKFYKVAKFLNKQKSRSDKEYRYYFEMNPNFYEWTKQFKDFFKQFQVQIIFKYSPTFGERLISEWRREKLKNDSTKK